MSGVRVRFCLLGGTGFIGTHLAQKLVSDGHYVRVYGRNRSRFHEVSGAEFFEGDLGNTGLIRHAIEGMDVVYHLVNTTLPKTSNDDPAYDIDSNLEDTVRVLQECVSAGIKRVVFTSSGGTVYGIPESIPISEGHPTEPISSYGIVKLATEKYLELFHRQHGLEYVALRVSNPYGAYQDPTSGQGIVGVFLDRLLYDREIEFWGDGSVVRDYLYISDLVDALTISATYSPRELPREHRHRVFNIGSGVGVSLREMLGKVEKVTGRKAKVKYLPGRTLDVPENVLDISRAVRDLAWTPQTSLEEGIGKTWLWAKGRKII